MKRNTTIPEQLGSSKKSGEKQRAGSLKQPSFPKSLSFERLIGNTTKIHYSAQITDAVLEMFASCIVPSEKTGMKIQEAAISIDGLMAAQNDELIILSKELKAQNDKMKDLFTLVRNYPFFMFEVIKENKIRVAHIAYEIQFCEDEINRCRTNLERIANFRTFISTIEKSQKIDLERFHHICIIPSPDAYILNLRKTQINKLQKSFTVPEILNPLLDPKSAHGNLIARFRSLADKAAIEDVMDVCRALYSYDLIIVQDILFDILYPIRGYDFCQLKSVPFPECPKAIPAIFPGTDCLGKWHTVTFEELRYSDWPFKGICDDLIEITFLTNPFRIARKFFEIQNKVSEKVIELYGKPVDVDFDMLFSLLQIIILVSGNPGLPMAMVYSFSFGEWAEEPSEQYGMTQLEGLYIHLVKMDPKQLEEQSAAILHHE